MISLLVLWGLDRFAGRRAANSNVEADLRELLIARAEGRIDPDEYEKRQAALHAQLLQAPPASSKPAPAVYRRWMLPALVLLTAAIGFAVFWSYQGQPAGGGAIDIPSLPDMAQKPQANSGGDLNTVVKRLADKMASDPGNGEGWLLLAKTYGELRKYAEAASAYEKAAAILPADAGMLADWADAHVMANGQKWDDTARKIVKRALASDPKHVKTLALAGSEAFDRGDYKAAIALWKRMKAAAPVDSMDSKLADANIEEANARLSGNKPVAAAPGDASAISGTLTVSPKLKAKIAADDTVFVFAKTPEGSGPPLAVKRFKGADLPLQFQLDDSAAVMPGRSISQFADVQVSAKVSRGGDAMPQKGDIFGAAVSAKPGSRNLTLELNQER
ncbi:MAG: tetratricopeptide repeat protein [Bacteroidota bacterium]